ncbi:MAG TPA: hypothetical protein VK154_11675 [Chitinophagales bacterium]|nr:hypothetical protein [Chitinophagales bacterium]
MTLIRTSFFKVLFLLLVYSLHLVFIQVLMEENSVKVVRSFKTLLSETTSNHTSNAPVTTYYQLHKHYSKQEKAKINAAEIVNSIIAQWDLPQNYGPTPTSLNPPYYFFVSDDVFKLYKAHRTFLI